ncbi:hypothetical protein F2Q69_00008824 [Brassica cretica]|uniref:Uncharacterized protein n=1 Tax=Brassica cretica TaxID=69181 RepID=A0A8S9NUI2_BRACR|nr:hypothetical protein F2Q69_00008824 [Brassica cretica]
MAWILQSRLQDAHVSLSPTFLSRLKTKSDNAPASGKRVSTTAGAGSSLLSIPRFSLCFSTCLSLSLPICFRNWFWVLFQVVWSRLLGCKGGDLIFPLSDLLSVLVVLGGGVKVWLPWFVVRRNLWPVVSFGIVSGHSFSPRCLGVWVSSRRCLVNSGGSFYLGAVS